MNNNMFYIHIQGYDFKIGPSVLESSTVNFFFLQKKTDLQVQYVTWVEVIEH